MCAAIGDARVRSATEGCRPVPDIRGVSGWRLRVAMESMAVFTDAPDLACTTAGSAVAFAAFIDPRKRHVLALLRIGLVVAFPTINSAMPGVRKGRFWLPVAVDVYGHDSPWSASFPRIDNLMAQPALKVFAGLLEKG